MNRINSYAWDTCLGRTSRRHSTHAQTRVERKHEITSADYINQGKIALVFSSGRLEDFESLLYKTI